jgi:putative transposase
VRPPLCRFRHRRILANESRLARGDVDDPVLDALEQALHLWERTEGLIHHRDRGSQFGSFRSPSAWPRLACDNALAESVIGLYKTELVLVRGVVSTTSRSQRWSGTAAFNNRRLLGPIGYIPPTEFEQVYYGLQNSAVMSAALN